MQGYYPIPCTLFSGYYRAINRVGDYDSLYSRIQKPFPDVLLAQKPNEKFALHLSGGFDSSILAKLYDREDVDYIHLTGPESCKARALAATLKGKLHELPITPELYIATADEIIPRLTEPYAFEDIVYAYLASKKARELGHTLVVSGDGGDGVFGGAYVGPYSRKACIIWKTIDPDQLLGLRTLQPYMHTALYAWSKTMLSPVETAFDKRFAAEYCRQLGLPEEIYGQKKEFWAGSHGIRTNEKVLTHMATVVDNSDYAWIRRFEFSMRPCADLPFRQYGLVKWLQTNHKKQLDSREIHDLSRQVEDFNRMEKAASLPQRRKEAVKRLIPPIALPLVRRIRRLLER
jgi:asparagine synthetase B (glutamine-hydrolysing)